MIKKSFICKSSKKRTWLLLAIIFFHGFSVLLSAFYDQASHEEVSLTEWGYWARFFTYWSAWASLITIPWAIYKLRKRRAKERLWGEQIISAVVVQTNLVSGLVFAGGGFLLTFPGWKRRINFLPFLSLFSQVRRVNIWLIYNFFWHIAAPALVVVYFWCYCRVDLLAKKIKVSLDLNTISPAVYFVYNLVRPEILNNERKLPHKYPPDYPYPPFFWCKGLPSHPSDQEKCFWFQQGWSRWQIGLIWTTITVTFWYLVFSGLLLFLIKIKSKQAQELKKRLLAITLTKPKASKNKLIISVAKSEYTLPDETREALEKILKIAVEKQNISGLVSLSLISKKESRQLNLRYRKINKSTDVLAFPFYYNYQKEIGSCSVGELRDLGDIFICYPVAQKQAQENQPSLSQEICFLFLHGLLHLLGYDHEKDKDRKIMFDLQDQILEKISQGEKTDILQS